MKTIIQTEHLTKMYGAFSAVSNNSISVKKGEIYGFLGLNGAGKTTTIRLLLGLIKASSGIARLNGMDVAKSDSSIWNQVGYLVETPHAYPTLSVRENLELFRSMRKLRDPLAVDRIMSLLGLQPYAKRKAKHLSLGNKQRLGLAKALIHQPEILILDEPTNGLDPAGIHDIREMLIDLAENKGVTILISSHILGEVSLFAHRIGIIHQSKMIDEFDTHQLNELCQRHLVIETNNKLQAMQILHEKGISNMSFEKDQLIVKDQQAMNYPENISKLLIQHQVDLKKINLEEENLESYFLRIIKEKEA